jgi:hypothetical protein
MFVEFARNNLQEYAEKFREEKMSVFRRFISKFTPLGKIVAISVASLFIAVMWLMCSKSH